MKMELTAKEVKGIGERRAMETLDRKYMPWSICGLVVFVVGLITIATGSEIGRLFVALGLFAVVVILFVYFWEAHLEGYKFLDSVIKGDTDKEQ